MVKNRILSFDWLRAIAASCVVFAHISIDAGIKTATGLQQTFPSLVCAIANPAVYIFLMISGALILTKYDTYDKISKKCLHLIYAGLLFVYPAAILERIFTEGFKVSVVYNGFIDFLTGDSWAVFWYLYMLFGFYLITPVLKKGIENPSNALWFCGLLYFFTSIVPLINELAGRTVIGMFLPIVSEYFVYFILGYIVTHFITEQQRKKFVIPGIIYSVIYLTALSVNYICNLGYDSILANNTLGLPYVVSIFILAMHYLNRQNKFIKLLSDCSFGIYLIHCYFINFIYKFLGFAATEDNFFCFIVIMFVIVFVLSLLSTYILRKIPFVKKYIL